MADRIGQQLGNYRLIRLIGEGGFAEVYLGEHLHLGTQAAIKILKTQLTSSDVEQFRSEARIIANLEHPNIVRILDFGVEGKIPFLVMSYAPNGTLRQQYPRGVSLPLPAILSYVKQIADALQYAHDQKLIHRDVKPENMLLGRRHEVLLSDFGIALATQSSRYQSTRDVVGTVAYMAPEQIQGKPRPASDQYALAVVVYVRDAVTSNLILTYRNHSKAVNTVEWASDGTRIVSASRDGTAQVWDAATDTITLTYRGHTNEVWSAGWSPDGRRVVSASADGTAQVWDATTGATLVTYRGHTTTVRSVSWSPDGQRIATASDDQTVQIWNASTGATLLIYHGHSDRLRTVAWSHDGTRIVSGARDATAQIWNATNGATIYIYRGHSATVFDAQWSPDDMRIVSGSTDTTVRVWQAS